MILGIKFFSEKAHLEAFLKGEIYFSTTGELALGDNTEINYKEYEIPLYNQKIAIEDIETVCDKLIFYYEWQTKVPIFCYYQLNTTNVETDKIPQQFANEGKKSFAAIFELSDLANRLENICEDKECGYKIVKTKYIDYEKKDNSWKEIVGKNKYGFLEVHDSKHSYQNEARIILTEIYADSSFAWDLGAWRNKPVPLYYNGHKWEIMRI